MKQFMCAEVESISPGSTDFKLVRETLLVNENPDLKNVKSYIEFKIQSSPFFKGKVILDNINFVDNVPDGLVVVGGSDGHPLIACWEREQ